MDQPLGRSRVRIRLHDAQETALIQSKAIGRVNHLHGVRLQIGRHASILAVTQMTAERGLVIDQDSLLASAGRIESRRHPGRATTNHRDLGLHISVLVLGAAGARLGHIAQSSHATDERLHGVPALWVGEYFVIPAYRHQPVEALPTFIRQLGHLPLMHSSPRGRWYLKLRLKMRRPDRYSADATESPSRASTGFPLKVKVTPSRPERKSRTLRWCWCF